MCSVMLLNVGLTPCHTAADPVQSDAAQCGVNTIVTLRRITLQMILCSMMLPNVGLTP